MFPRKKRLWWLPLAIIMVCVLGTWLYSLVFSGGREPDRGVIRQEIVDGQSYDVLEQAFQGDFQVKKVCFLADPASGAGAEVLCLPLGQDGTVPEGFAQAKIMDQALYEAYCRTWGLTPAFRGKVAVIACAVPGAADTELQVGDLIQAADTATVWLRDRAQGEGAGAAGFVLVFPVDRAVQKLNICPLYTPEEVEALGRGEALPGRILGD